jgi:lysophospholipase L1-like esterase
MRKLLRLVAPVAAIAAVLVPAAPAHAATNYVALGDSYSSGTGSSTYDLNSSCQRSTKAYPSIVATAKAYSLNFVACSGAKTTDVISSQIGALNTGTNLVTVSAGGNDVGFSSLIVTCTLLGCTTDVNNKITWVNANLGAILDNLYNQIRSHAPNAQVIVLGYPKLFTKTCLGATGISSSEVTAANNLAVAIDNVTAARAAAHGFVYKSAIAQFTNHGVCASTSWINGLNLFNSSSSYHPNNSGHSSGYAPLVRQVTG